MTAMQFERRFINTIPTVTARSHRTGRHSFSKMSGKKILCTGGAGYIGIHTAVHLEKAGYRCFVLDNLSNTSLEAVKRLRKLVDREVEFAHVDLKDFAAVKALFDKEKFDGVVHYAALKAVGESVAKPLAYYENNLLSLINLLKAMKETGCKTLVFSSSATVYKAAETQRRLNEDDPLFGYNPYGQTKLMCEQIIRDVCVSDPNLKVAVLRYFNPVGAHPSGVIGESPDYPMNILPFIQQVAVGRRDHLNVFGNDWDTPDGTGVRDYIHVEDLAEGHIAAFKKMDTVEDPGCMFVYNLGTGRGISVLELVEEFEKATTKKIPYKITERRAGDLGYAVADPTKANQELSWEAKRTISEACASAWKWQSGNPLGYSTESK